MPQQPSTFGTEDPMTTQTRDDRGECWSSFAGQPYHVPTATTRDRRPTVAYPPNRIGDAYGRPTAAPLKPAEEDPTDAPARQ